MSKNVGKRRRGQKKIVWRYLLAGAMLAIQILLTIPQAAGRADAAGDTITVSFRLIGSTESEKVRVGTKLLGAIDLAKDTGYMGAEYVTWIPTKQYILPAGSIVYDLFVKAVAEAGLKSESAKDNYVKTIYAPEIYGGYALSEYTNGNSSGWMYTVNGVHTDVGLQTWKLQDKDQIIWHYTNDYKCEIGDREYADSKYAQYWNKWLSALDTAPISSDQEQGGRKDAGNAESVKLDKTRLILYRKEKYRLKSTLFPADTKDQVIWSSSKKKVAKVSADGTVTALKKGSATITAKLPNGKSSACRVTVKTLPTRKIRLNVTKKTLRRGKTLKLKASAVPKNTTDSFQWRSSNKKIARVSSDGKVKALKRGKAKITCRTDSGKRAVCVITVTDS